MSSEDDTRISWGRWLLVGGRGPPPTCSAFLRMASERKASHRETCVRHTARNESYAKTKKEHGTGGFVEFVKTQFGLEKPKEVLKRKELMEVWSGDGALVGEIVENRAEDIGSGGCNNNMNEDVMPNDETSVDVNNGDGEEERSGNGNSGEDENGGDTASSKQTPGNTGSGGNGEKGPSAGD
ncbi:hypothetical protein BKA67DRAFT_530026 [Truncatella angustata]|uniref:Uncharacterized protein n=1 Tax=Truncatella angustata TaxID=152316 RepID=A0A9P8UXN3_9PEZI|nr:uncharacterized protein BKA67DRAFT_530026 [Truncatella angustata]KAH6659901.1 hypothetical protein BKA67DRAFT_530026 [Truncatella angustata]